GRVHLEDRRQRLLPAVARQGLQPAAGDRGQGRLRAEVQGREAQGWCDVDRRLRAQEELGGTWATGAGDGDVPGTSMPGRTFSPGDPPGASWRAGPPGDRWPGRPR